MTKYAITGVTGNFGQTAINALTKLRNSADVVALARNVTKASQTVPAGVEVRPGDYTNIDELTDSLRGVDKLLFVSSQPGGPVSREQQHQNVIKAAVTAGVSYIAYTSFPHANTSTAPLAADHQATETAIINSGLQYSFLRNNWYIENELGVIKTALNGNPFVYSADNGHVGWALEDEYAQAAVKVLISKAPKSIYEFAGPSNTYADMAQAVARVTDQKFEIRSITDDQYQNALKKNGLDEATAAIIVGIQASIREGNLDEQSTDLPDVLGHPLASLPDAIDMIR